MDRTIVSYLELWDSQWHAIYQALDHRFLRTLTSEQSRCMLGQAIDLAGRLRQTADEIELEVEQLRNRISDTENHLMMPIRNRLTWQEAANLLHLTETEFRTAAEIGIVHGVWLPGTPASWEAKRYDREKLPITREQREQIADHTLLTRKQAAERLGITRRKFDTRRQQAGLKPINAPSLHGTVQRSRVDLYCQSGIDKLK